MEKTENVKGDKATIGSFEARQQGKRLSNQYLAGEIASIEAELKKADAAEQGSLKQGCFDVFISQITLPDNAEDIKRLEKIGKGITAITGDKRFSMVYEQFLQAVSQYLNEAAQYEEALKRQYAPKLRQKEEELARRIGRQVRIDPFQDPEFIAFYNQHINALRGNYETLAEEVRQQAREVFA